MSSHAQKPAAVDFEAANFTSSLPTLYSFRRCPYAMRARMALAVSGARCVLREVVLRDKPKEMLELSPKGTVPVLVLPDGAVLDESLDIMRWALERDDPQNWLPSEGEMTQTRALISENDGSFKRHLDRYKYPNRYDDVDPIVHRGEAMVFVNRLAAQLGREAFLFGGRPGLADIAVFPFLRQFANTDRAWFDAAAPKVLRAWLDRCLVLPIFAAVMEKYPPWTPQAAPTLFPPKS